MSDVRSTCLLVVGLKEVSNIFSHTRWPINKVRTDDDQQIDNHGSTSSTRRPDAVLLGSSIKIKKIGFAVDE